MFRKLMLAFARKSVAVVSGPGAAALSGAAASSNRPRVTLASAGPDERDPSPPPVTLTLVERRRLRVDPLNEYGGKIPCGPFEWRLSNPRLAKLDVAGDTRSVWLYAVELGQCAVTVTGAGRESALDVAIVDAIPVTLNLVADEPEVYRSLAVLDGSAGGVL